MSGGETVHRWVEVTPEVVEQIAKLDSDVITLTQLTTELAANVADMLKALLSVNGSSGSETAVEPTLPVDATSSDLYAPVEIEGGRSGKKRQVPEAMATPVAPTLPDESERRRNSPFSRAPRSVQIAWLKQEVLADGNWHAASTIAREYGNDERHMRYLRGAISGRLREMWEDGDVERRDSHVKGSMFEYRIPPGR